MLFHQLLKHAESRWSGRHLWIAASPEDARRLMARGPDPTDVFADTPEASHYGDDDEEPIILEFLVRRWVTARDVQDEHGEITVQDPKALRFLRVWSGVVDDPLVDATRGVFDELDEIAIGGLKRCTAVTVNALCKFFRKPGITLGQVPETDVGVLAILSQSGLAYRPAAMAAGRSVQQFVNLNQRGAWYIVTEGHAMALVQGELFDAENRGPDGRKIIQAFAISVARA